MNQKCHRASLINCAKMKISLSICNCTLGSEVYKRVSVTNAITPKFYIEMLIVLIDYSAFPHVS